MSVFLNIPQHATPVFRRHVQVEVTLVELRFCDLFGVATFEAFERKLKQLSSNLHTDYAITCTTSGPMHCVVFVVYIAHGVKPRH